jgi:UDP-2,3-diacylglucosamine pyrophosphatase LpxH
MLEDRKTLVIEEEEQKPEWKKSFKATRTTTTTTSSFSTTCIITSSLVRNREKVTDAHLCYTLAQQRYHKNSRKNKTKTKNPKRNSERCERKTMVGGHNHRPTASSTAVALFVSGFRIPLPPPPSARHLNPSILLDE